MIVLHSYTLVLSSDVLGAHRSFAYGERMSFSLSKYCHHRPLLTGGHTGVRVGQT